MENRIDGLENRVGKLELAFSEMKAAHVDAMDQLDAKLDTIVTFVTGANTVFGFAKQHWKTAITFGAGIMSALGVGNPAVLNFVSSFFGASA